MDMEKMKSILDELRGSQFKQLKFYLEHSPAEEDEAGERIGNISTSDLESANTTFDLVGLLVQYYTRDATRVLAAALDKIPRRDLVAKLGRGARPREPLVPRQSNTRHEPEPQNAAGDKPQLERYEMSNQRVAFMMCVTKEREGSEKDIDKMKKLFKTCGFYTPVKHCINPSKTELMAGLEEFRLYISTSAEKISCCLITLMSHGDQGIILDQSGAAITLDEIFKLFNNKECPKLQGKPKIFIIQACRGSGKDKGIKTDAKTEELKGKQKLPTASDYFIVYSSQEGLVALRDQTSGSVMITAIDEVFSAHWRNWHVGDLFTKVNSKMVEQEFHVEDVEETVKVCSVIQSTLTKAVYFK